MSFPSTSRSCAINSKFDELVYWKNLALNYKAKYEELLMTKKRTQCISSEFEDHPATKIKKVENNLKDPVFEFNFSQLPRHVHQKIFSNFKAKELLRLTEVSASWKVLIESDEVLTKKIYNNVQLTLRDAFNNKDWITLLLNNRQYKHLKLIDCFDEEKSIIERFASRLESLAIQDSIDFRRQLQVSGIIFPKLKTLVVSHYNVSWLQWLEKCKFPSLIRFRYKHEYSHANQHQMQFYGKHYVNLLNHMPRLKHLLLNILDYDELDSFVPKFKLISADIEETLPIGFLSKMIPTLKTLHVSGNFHDLSEILDTLHSIETLAFKLVYDYMGDNVDEEEEEEFIDCLSLHENITTLKIDVDNSYELRQIVCALPELQTLICYKFITQFDLTTLVRCAPKLQKLICRNGVQEFIFDIYEELLLHTYDEDLNSGIEICIEDRQKWCDDR